MLVLERSAAGETAQAGIHMFMYLNININNTNFYREGDKVPSGVSGPQASGPLREWRGAGHRHVYFSVMLYLPYEQI